MDERNQLNQLQREMGRTQSDLDQGRREERTLLGQLQTLEEQMRATQSEIDVLRNNIDEMQRRINEAAAELDALEKNLHEQNESLLGRLSAMYMNGSIGIIDVLLGSGSISDFMTNMDRIQLIYESDREVIALLEEQHQILEVHRRYLQQLQDELVAEREKEANKRESLRVNQQKTSEKRAEVVANNKALQEMMDAQQAEADRLIAVILARQGDGLYVGGSMAWPVPGAYRVTSEFGMRTHPILRERRMHAGMDIACPTGTRVVAANGGRVMTSGWNNSYGYVVMIDHGGQIVTLYAHNSSLLVNEGDIVSRGQVIALSGSTGMSTGPHLHFEVRVNGVYKDPRGYL